MPKTNIATATLATLTLMSALLCSAPSAFAQQPEPDSTVGEALLTVKLELELDGVPEEHQVELGEAMRSELDALSESMRFEPSTGDNADIIIHVGIRTPEPDVFMIDAWAESDGSRLSQQTGDACMACTNAEISAKGLALLPDAVDRVRAERAAAEPPAPVTQPEVDEPSPVVERRSPIGPAGYLGIASSGVGLGLVVFGAVYIHRGKVVTGDSSNAVLDYTDYRPAGVALVGAGLGAMVIGNVLLAVDVGVLRSRREQRSPTHARITGITFAADDGASLVIRGQF